jgi:translin
VTPAASDSAAARAAARLQAVAAEAAGSLEQAHAARESALTASRETIQLSSRSIRAAHRGEFDDARALSRQAGEVIAGAYREVAATPGLQAGGYLSDAEKEFAESAITLAFLAGDDLPGPSDLGVGAPAYLNGLAEAASELRRAALDAIRHGDASRADALLALMDEAMAVLTAIDFPEAVTGGLRRTTDQLRAVTERTRGDVTAALRQTALEERMSALEKRLGDG